MPTQEIDLGNVQGPKGDTGPQGPQGAQGPEGPQGPPGEFDMDAGLSFTEATTRANINTGESLKTILGKIKKFFTDLKPHAFSNPVNNLTGTDASLPLAAPQGKALKQEIDELNSALEARNFSGGEVAAHSYQDVTFTFSKKHSSAPVVVACLAGKADTLHRASINLSVFDKTTSGFKVRIYNDSEAVVNVELSWIAMET